MAISWDIETSNANVASKRVDVKFTRTDSENSANPWTKTYNNTLIETQEQRIALLDAVWIAWQAHLSKQDAIDNFLENLEQIGKANLEAREI